MSTQTPALAQRLTNSSHRVTTIAPRAFLTVLGISVVGLACTWVAELADVAEVAGLLAGVLLAVWVSTGALTLLAFVLVVLSRLAAAVLKLCAAVAAPSMKTERGED